MSVGLRAFALLALLSIASPASAMVGGADEPSPYLIDNNVIAKVECGRWAGTGVYVGNGLVATAKHVTVDGGCKAGGIAATLVPGSVKPGSDFALLSIDGRAPFRALIDCGGFREGELYLVTGYAEDAPATVSRLLTGSVAKSSEKGFGGMIVFRGAATQGMSGGPIVRLINGALVGLLTANTDDGITQVLGIPLSDTPLCRKGGGLMWTVLEVLGALAAVIICCWAGGAVLDFIDQESE